MQINAKLRHLYYIMRPCLTGHVWENVTTVWLTSFTINVGNGSYKLSYAYPSTAILSKNKISNFKV